MVRSILPLVLLFAWVAVAVAGEDLPPPADLTPQQAETLKRLFGEAEFYVAVGGKFSEKGELDKGLVYYRKALEVDPKNYNATYNIAYTLGIQGKYDEALEWINKAISIQRTANALNIRGLIYYRTDQPEKALQDYSEAIKIDPKFKYPYRNRADLYLDQKRYEEAIADYTKAIELDPNYASAIFGRGVAYFYLGDKEKAKQDIMKACSMGLKEACP